MSWGIEFNTDIFISKENYQENIYQVQDAIDECNDNIQTYKHQLFMFSSANIGSIVPSEWIEEPIRWLHIQLNELYNSIEEEYRKLFKLELYNEYLKEKNSETK